MPRYNTVKPLSTITITLSPGHTFTRRVTAQDRHEGVFISEGDKRSGTREHYDETTVVLTREELAKLARLFPVLTAPTDLF